MTAHTLVPPAADASLSLADTAYRTLQDRLIMLVIPPGAPLNDAQLASELGCGRTPVREALKRLEADHLVVTYPRRGTFATGVDIRELANISEIRLLLEPLAARRAAVMATTEQRSQMRLGAAAVEALPDGGGQSALMRSDMAAHRLIYRAAANPHLEDILVRYDNLATRIWCLVLGKLPPVTSHIAEHTELLTAIAEGDGERAAGLASDHVSGFERTLRTVL